MCAVKVLISLWVCHKDWWTLWIGMKVTPSNLFLDFSWIIPHIQKAPEVSSTTVV